MFSFHKTPSEWLRITPSLYSLSLFTLIVNGGPSWANSEIGRGFVSGFSLLWNHKQEVSSPNNFFFFQKNFYTIFFFTCLVSEKLWEINEMEYFVVYGLSPLLSVFSRSGGLPLCSCISHFGNELEFGVLCSWLIYLYNTCISNYGCGSEIFELEVFRLLTHYFGIVLLTVHLRSSWRISRRKRRGGEKKRKRRSRYSHFTELYILIYIYIYTHFCFGFLSNCWERNVCENGEF